MIFDTNLLSHLHAVRDSVKSFGARVGVEFDTLKIEVRAHGRRVELLPQFILQKDDKPAYTPRFVPDARGFIGWRPYFNRVWPAAVDKQTFKEFCMSAGLQVPKRFARIADVSCDVLVKRSRSSFGLGMLGPFQADQCKRANIALGDGDFIEEFINGDIAKIWYWNTEPVAMDVRSMPSVDGDGKSSVRELVQRKAPVAMATQNAAWGIIKSVVEYQGLSLDDVVAQGRRVMVDYRFQSLFLAAQFEKVNVLPAIKGSSLEQQLVEAGTMFWQAIPESIRMDTLYTIDAVIDRDRRAQFLEMNCNPFVHVDAYRPMIASIFSERSDSQNAVPRLAAAPRGAGQSLH